MAKNYTLEMLKKMEPANKKIAADLAVAIPLLERVVANDDMGKCLSPVERMALIRMVPCNLHEDGKIEGISSIDSSCGGCEFCQKMRDAAKANPAVICGYCYDAAQEAYRKGMAQRHTLTAAILSIVLFDVGELAVIPGTRIVREDSSGDVINIIHGRNYIRYTYAHQYSDVALWAKNTAATDKAFDIEGKPANMRFIQSCVMINGKVPNPSKYADNVFVVYLTEEDVQKAIAAGANECNGRKCMDCGFMCYKQDGWEKGTIIAELFRGSKKNIAEIKKRLSA